MYNLTHAVPTQFRHEILKYAGHINSAIATHIVAVFGLTSLGTEHVN